MELVTENVEQLVENIEKISKLGDELFNSRLRTRTIILLVSKASGVKLDDVEAVLHALPQLKEIYLKPKED